MNIKLYSRIIYLNSIILLLFFGLKISFGDIEYASNIISKVKLNTIIYIENSNSIPTNETKTKSSYSKIVLPSPTSYFNNTLTEITTSNIQINNYLTTNLSIDNNSTVDYSVYPSIQPSGANYLTNITTSTTPTLIPTIYDTISPSIKLSSIPSIRPTFQPSTRKPSIKPTIILSTIPSKLPTLAPLVKITKIPTFIPTIRPTTIMPSKPTTDPTLIPTMNPTTIPTIIPTYIPSEIPSTQPSSQPSSQPTIAPSISQKPTPMPSRPTCNPTIIPSFIPTIQNSPKLKFFTNITFNIINETDLDYNAQISIIHTIAKVMNILDSYITVHHISYNEITTHHKMKINKAVSDINSYNSSEKQYEMIVTNKVTLLLSSSSQYTSPNTLYESLIQKLSNSFSDGTFSNILHQQSQIYNATILYSIIIHSITYSKLFLTYPYKDVKKTLTMGDIIGIIICIIVIFLAILCIIGYYYKEYYSQRKVAVYVPWKDEEKDIETISMY